MCPELLMLWFCTFHRTISCLHVDFEFKLALWPTLRQKFMKFSSFWLVQSINMTKRSTIYCSSNPKLVQAPAHHSAMSLKIFLLFSRHATPNLMVFSEISFWNEMFLCSIKTEMFTPCNTLTVQCRQQETMWRFCETFVGHLKKTLKYWIKHILTLSIIKW